MRTLGGNVIFVVILTLLITVGMSVTSALAETSDDISELQAEIDQRKAAISDINRKLEEYRAKIKVLSGKSASLLNDLALIENQSAMAKLDIVATQTEIETQNLQLAETEASIREETQRLEAQREMLSALLFSLNQQEERGVVATMFGSGSFHEAFDTVAQLEEVNTSLEQAVNATKQSRTVLEADRAELESALASLTELESELQTRLQKLDMQETAKSVLIEETQESEAEYTTLMSELRQEQQYIASQVSALQKQYASKIDDADEAGDASVMSWPLEGRITALFHDTTYPFRHLFQHSGLDIGVPVGTAIEAAAPGYVAWSTTGRSYGNYVMIIHADGLATLYAHMSRLDVVQDQYVSRGQQIGLSGGKPGMQGAGLSTGPHLHFEVRKDGIPTNPMDYLMAR